jgi:hypothetical protein
MILRNIFTGSDKDGLSIILLIRLVLVKTGE